MESARSPSTDKARGKRLRRAPPAQERKLLTNSTLAQPAGAKAAQDKKRNKQSSMTEQIA